LVVLACTEVLLLALVVTNEEAAPVGLQINWSKTKIQQIGNPPSTENAVAVCNANVEFAESFLYLGSE